MADTPLTPDAYLVYAKGSRRYWVVTLKPDEVPEIYKGGETVPLYRATPDAELPEGVTPGSWGDLKLQMEASAWDGSLRLEDALANIDEFMARAPSPPVAAPAEQWEGIRRVQQQYIGLTKAAVALIAAVQEQHDTHDGVLKYAVPYGAVVALGNALQGVPPRPGIAPLSDEVAVAAQAHASVYADDDRQDITTDVFNAFAAGAKWAVGRPTTPTPKDPA